MTHQSCKIGCVYKTPFRKSGHIYTRYMVLEYSDVFAISKDQLGCTDMLQYKIITEHVSPIHQKFHIR